MQAKGPEQEQISVADTFTAVRATHLHPPYGLWIVSHGGTVIGRQLSQPSPDDCRRMLRLHVDGAPKLDYFDDRLARQYGRLYGPRGVAARQSALRLRRLTRKVD